MIPDVEVEDMGEVVGPPRVAFQVVPAVLVRPAPATAWQSLFAGTLLLFTLGSCLQLGLAANVHLLPKVPNPAQTLSEPQTAPSCPHPQPWTLVAPVAPQTRAVFRIRALELYKPKDDSSKHGRFN
jgi:hypothetical protein